MFSTDPKNGTACKSSPMLVALVKASTKLNTVPTTTPKAPFNKLPAVLTALENTFKDFVLSFTDVVLSFLDFVPSDTDLLYSCCACAASPVPLLPFFSAMVLTTLSSSCSVASAAGPPATSTILTSSAIL